MRWDDKPVKRCVHINTYTSDKLQRLFRYICVLTKININMHNQCFGVLQKIGGSL